ncbi:MAG: hypothetical protein WBG71_15785 [Leeuwenhoekiella sp.]
MSKITKSDLIAKIDAVQEQVMAQGNVSEDEEEALLSLCSIVSRDDGLANYSPDERMVLKDADRAPVYEGCDGVSEEETRDCFDNKIETFIKREFDRNAFKDLNLSKPKRVDAFFIIDENGNPTGMKVRNSEVTIQAEILRVLRKLPVMKTAIHNGQNVSVLCSIVINYGNKLEVDVAYIPERPNA